MADLKNEFSWSKSRDATFRECLRAYYWHHYGSWGGWDLKAPPQARELYLMKNLDNRATFIGRMVHDVAERALRTAVRGRPWQLSAALPETEQRVRQELEASRQGLYRQGHKVIWAGKPQRLNGLQEHFYGETVAEEEWEAAVSLILQCVTRLYETSAFRRLLEVGQETILSIEELRSFLVGDVKVWVKLDVAVRGKGGEVVILDWKTGGSPREEDIALQLGIYGLFGCALWQVEPERILGYDINLRDGSSHQHLLDATILEEVRQYVVRSAEDMRSLLDDVPGNKASLERFPQTDQLSTCRRCRFRRACQREEV